MTDRHLGISKMLLSEVVCRSERDRNVCVRVHARVLNVYLCVL